MKFLTWILATLASAAVSVALFYVLPQGAYLPVFSIIIVSCLVVCATHRPKKPAFGLALSALVGTTSVVSYAYYSVVNYEWRPRSSMVALSEAKQVATAALMYAADNDECMPGANWPVALDAYLKKTEPLFLRPGVTGWTMNQHVANAKRTSFAHPDQVPFIFESDTTASLGNAFDLRMPPKAEDRTVVSFVDSHAKLLDRHAIQKLVFVP